MKICVFGAGAVGGNLAARLVRSGNEVAVVARGAYLAAIRERGLTIHAGEERINERVRASDRPADFGPQDVVISTLKASGLPALAHGIAPLLGPETSVIFAQNGIPWWYSMGLTESASPLPDLSALDPAGALASNIPQRSIVAGVVYSANTVMAPGVINNASPDQNRVSLANIDDSASDRLSQLRRMFTDASIDSPEVTNIRQEIWQKLLSNLVTGMTILVEEPTSTMLAGAGMRKVAERLIAEATAIARAHGIQVEPRLPNVPVNKKSSILQDYEQHRTMEVEAQLLAPLAFARSAMVAAPTLEAVATIIAHRATAKGLYSSSSA